MFKSELFKSELVWKKIKCMRLSHQMYHTGEKKDNRLFRKKVTFCYVFRGEMVYKWRVNAHAEQYSASIEQ